MDKIKMLSRDERFINYTLKPDNIPEQFHHLIPLAQYWGTWGDYQYSYLIDESNDDVLKELINEVRPYYGRILDEWLGLESSTSNGMTNEYIAFDDLLRSYDLAKIELRNRAEKLNHE